MKYISQLKAWGDASVNEHVSIMAQALYSRLLIIINKHAQGENWPHWFPIGRKQLARELGVTTRTITNLKNELTEKGFIQTREGERKYTDCMEYHIIPLYDDKPATQNRPQPTQAAEDAEAQKYIAKLDNAARAYFGKLQDATDLSDLQTAQYLAVLGTDKCKNILNWVLKKGDAVGNVGNYFKWKANETIKKAQHTQALLASIPQQQQQEQLDSWLD